MGDFRGSAWCPLASAQQVVSEVTPDWVAKAPKALDEILGQLLIDYLLWTWVCGFTCGMGYGTSEAEWGPQNSCPAEE